jgi:hypothetical protein
MRIIGGKDYYDAGLMYGIDEDTVFVRHKNKTLDNIKYQTIKRMSELSVYGYTDGKNSFKLYNHGYDSLGKLRFKEYKFIIAGKLYNCISIRDENSSVENFCWSYSKFDNILSKYRYKRCLNKPTKYFYTYDKVYVEPNWFNTFNLTDESIQFLINNRITIAHKETSNYSSDSLWNIDPYDLYSFDMVKRIDPFTLFQQISSWVSGVLPRNPNPITEITDDKVKIHKHGFDKLSFRKMKV